MAPGCYLAYLTRLALARQYVNYSNIALKTVAPAGAAADDVPPEIENGEIEARINQEVLRVPECGQCANCTETSKARKLCVKRLQTRKKLVAAETAKIYSENKGKKGKKRKQEKMTQFPNPKKPKISPAPKKKIPKMMKTANGQVKPRVTSQGNKRMAIPDEHFPEFCRRIGATGTGERMKLINQFAEEHPTVSVRQVTLKLGEITTKEMPACVKPSEEQKKQGRAFMFYLRPRFYKYLPPEERPEGWEKYAELDEKAWQSEQAERKRKRAEKGEGNSEFMDSASNISPSVGDGDGDDDDDEGGDETEDEGAERAPKRLKVE